MAGKSEIVNGDKAAVIGDTEENKRGDEMPPTDEAKGRTHDGRSCC